MLYFYIIFYTNCYCLYAYICLHAHMNLGKYIQHSWTGNNDYYKMHTPQLWRVQFANSVNKPCKMCF